jgi:hypothetical protein
MYINTQVPAEDLLIQYMSTCFAKALLHPTTSTPFKYQLQNLLVLQSLMYNAQDPIMGHTHDENSNLITRPLLANQSRTETVFLPTHARDRLSLYFHALQGCERSRYNIQQNVHARAPRFATLAPYINSKRLHSHSLATILSSPSPFAISSYN